MRIPSSLLAVLAALALVAVVAACDDDRPVAQPTSQPIPASEIADPGPIEIVPGRTYCVPAYMGIRYYDEGRIYPLAVTLSVRNVDPARLIVLEVIDFFDSSGELVERFLTGPLRVEPLATAEFFVPERDTPSSSGASFIVRWNANGPVHEPAIESVMIGTSGTQGISFTAQAIPYGERLTP